MTANAMRIKQLAKGNGPCEAFGTEHAVTRGSIYGRCEAFAHFALKRGWGREQRRGVLVCDVNQVSDGPNPAHCLSAEQGKLRFQHIPNLEPASVSHCAQHG
jgi:hypothetical protein